VWLETNRQPSSHYKSDKSTKFVVFPSVHPFHASTVNKIEDEPKKAMRKVEGEVRSLIRGYVPSGISGKGTYDQASTTRFVGFLSEGLNCNCWKRNLLFSLKYVVRPWTPMVKGRNTGDVRGLHPNAEFRGASASSAYHIFVLHLQRRRGSLNGHCVVDGTQQESSFYAGDCF